MAYTRILYHLVFRTKSSGKTIPLDHAPELYRYIWGILKNKNCVLYRINGMEEHVHILFDLHPSVALADLVKDIKVASSKWMKQSGLFPDFTGWGIKLRNPVQAQHSAGDAAQCETMRSAGKRSTGHDAQCAGRTTQATAPPESQRTQLGLPPK